jgi:2-polyprenyl-3-methyl-5-hydroxy-6-metoxy-1,4-benzoquinol methylase
MGHPAVSHHEQQDQVNDHFRSQAAYWKDLYARTGVQAEVHRDRFATALAWIDSLAMAPGSRVLEIGCGAGFLAVTLAELGFRVAAIDAAEAMVELAREHAEASATAELISVQLGDVQALAFADDSFDLVVALGVIPWLPQPELAMREMARVTRPGGTVLLTADNVARLITVLDPWNHPALAPLRKHVKTALMRVGLQDGSSPQRRSVTVTYHSAWQINEALASVQLAKIRGKTLGFGPFTIRGHSLLPRRLSIPLHRRLQQLADEGVPPFQSTGAQHLVLARKSILHSPA